MVKATFAPLPAESSLFLQPMFRVTDPIGRFKSARFIIQVFPEPIATAPLTVTAVTASLSTIVSIVFEAISLPAIGTVVANVADGPYTGGGGGVYF